VVSIVADVPQRRREDRHSGGRDAAGGNWSGFPPSPTDSAPRKADVTGTFGWRPGTCGP